MAEHSLPTVLTLANTVHARPMFTQAVPTHLSIAVHPSPTSLTLTHQRHHIARPMYALVQTRAFGTRDTSEAFAAEARAVVLAHSIGIGAVGGTVLGGACGAMKAFVTCARAFDTVPVIAA